ncbi:MAG: hypothetical protein GWN16_04310, partial [Calditrichae bacterium]|nr:hypothetical protein [Calditrichia bacterium]
MFMAIVTLALLAYLTASSDYMEVARRNIVRFLVEKKFALPLTIIAILIPSLVATKVYLDATEPPQPPLLGRTIHPPPP